jgi:Zn-dependent peptidase ImmA (M78 family)
VRIPFLPPEDIEAAADGFRAEWHPEGTVPVPIVEIVELKLRINIVPSAGLLNQHNVDAFLLRDLKDLIIDQDIYLHEDNRARFSFAHEVGHIALHAEYLKSLQIGSIDDWKNEVLGKGSGHAPLETQANMFASFLLMPTRWLEQEFARQRQFVDQHPLFEKQKLADDRVLAQYVARPIAKVFGVSEEAAGFRLQNWLGAR